MEETEKRRRGRPNTLSRERILAAAERLEFEELTVVRLAKSLRVTDAAIYYYFRSREALCRALVDRWSEGFATPPPDLHWRDWLHELAHETYRRLGERPGAADFMIYAGPSGKNQLLVMNTAFAVLTKAGFSPAEALRTYSAVMSSAINAARQRDTTHRYQVATGRSALSALVDRFESFEGMAPGYDAIRQALGHSEPPDPAAGFAFMIGGLVAGLPAPQPCDASAP